MSFETARPVTPESFNQDFQFMRRPQVQYPVDKAIKQRVNISEDTRARIALRKKMSAFAPKLSYNPHGLLEQGTAKGQRFSALA